MASKRITKNKSLRFFCAVVFLAGLGINPSSFAQEPAAQKPAAPAGTLASDYTAKGADTCLKCHDEDSEFPVLSIFKTKHTRQADKRTPFARLQCETCHGPGANHAKKVPPGQNQAHILAFGRRSKLAADSINPVPPKQQNKVCLECHQNNGRIGWAASQHEGNDLACASCHKVHAVHDAVLSKRTQPDVCYRCHQQKRAEFLKPSSHPVRFGQMACSDCHDPHGDNANTLLAKPTVNQTCYTCHAGKRGPFLWEHAPVAEDCTNCHTVHGSIHPVLLTKRPPLLCQQCHSQVGHPSLAHTADGLPSGTPSAFLLAGSCTNCHSQVHGSNHPSGVKLMR